NVLTRTILVRMPGAVAVAVKLMAALPPGAMVPRSATTVPAAFDTEPCEAEAETKLMPAGRALETRTLKALFAPRLVTVIDAVKLLPVVTGFGEMTLVMLRSVWGSTAVTTGAAVLLARFKSISPLALATVPELVTDPALVGIR